MAIYMWKEYVAPPTDYLCLTANTAGSTVQLNKTWSPTTVTLETSTDGSTRTTYTIWNTITLSNIWDKVYWRNTSETTTGFSSGSNNCYVFALTWSINASGDVTSLINKNCTDTLTWNGCFYRLFYNSSSNTVLKTAPSLPATTITTYCYYEMFRYCSNLEQLPKLPALTLAKYCYNNMFRDCSKIKVSSSQTGEYQTEYRIPTTWTGTTASYAVNNMFTGTWWTFIWAPTINTTYYTSNTLV